MKNVKNEIEGLDWGEESKELGEMAMKDAMEHMNVGDENDEEDEDANVREGRREVGYQGIAIAVVQMAIDDYHMLERLGIIAEDDDPKGKFLKGDLIKNPTTKISKSYSTKHQVHRLLKWIKEGDMQKQIQNGSMRTSATYIMRHAGIPQRPATDKTDKTDRGV